MDATTINNDFMALNAADTDRILMLFYKNDVFVWRIEFNVGPQRKPDGTLKDPIMQLLLSNPHQADRYTMEIMDDVAVASA